MTGHVLADRLYPGREQPLGHGAGRALPPSPDPTTMRGRRSPHPHRPPRGRAPARRPRRSRPRRSRARSAPRSGRRPAGRRRHRGRIGGRSPPPADGRASAGGRSLATRPPSWSTSISAPGTTARIDAARSDTCAQVLDVAAEQDDAERRLFGQQPRLVRGQGHSGQADDRRCRRQWRHQKSARVQAMPSARARPQKAVASATEAKPPVRRRIELPAVAGDVDDHRGAVAEQGGRPPGQPRPFGMGRRLAVQGGQLHRMTACDRQASRRRAR